MKGLIQLFTTLFSRPPTLWQILFMTSFGFWAIAAINPNDQQQELLALCGFLCLIYALWTILNQYSLRYFWIDLKPIIVWFVFCVIVSIKLNRFSQKVLWVSYPEVVAITQIVPDLLSNPLQKNRLQLQKNIIILLCGLLISCWIYSYFMIDEWVIENSELVDQNMEESLFVIKFSLDNLRLLSD
ncbi:DUF5357 family protein [Roseofilum capinflatum]|uniref:DUF5357 family protein n=1 Tax=Roseofilum capinflatum BLCC-M114 TaxID=3022440 RepID=A0ABT7B0I4_9CYAN|nr:DUF5357 family protein [Roseofilum capinflatum]MDJ1172680.1 DUF5357 family protein [Roseofilum capinflatum BLCC-M114]